jgi:predicted transcriptional regulator with HTH domain
MYLLLYIISLLGIYAIMTAFFPFAGINANRAIAHFTKTQGKHSDLSTLQYPIMWLALRIMPIVRLSKLRHVTLENSLKNSKIADSPERFTARVISEGIFLAALSIPLFFLSQIVAAGPVVFSIYHVFSRFKNLEIADKERSRDIERELPRLASYIKQGLAANGNILLLLERYRSRSDAFAEEIAGTIADIKTSNFESALLRLGGRYNSEHLSMLIRGLIGVYNGDDMRYYFEMLEKDFTELEINMLRLEVRKIPRKMRTSMIVVYAAIALLFFTPVFILITESLSQFFS